MFHQQGYKNWSKDNKQKWTLEEQRKWPFSSMLIILHSHP